METITNESSAYVLETTGDTFKAVNSEKKQVVYIQAPIQPIVIHSNSKEMYIPTLLHNENSLLKQNKNINIKRLSSTVQCSVVNDKKRSLNQSLKQEPAILNHVQKLPRKKMSYERDFKPSVLSNKESHSYNVFNRHGKRKLIVDQQTVIGGRQFKRQIINTHDIVVSPELAPRTKKEMNRLLSGITKMFAYPAHKICNSQLLQLYVANCTSSEQPNVETVSDMELSPIDKQTLFNKTVRPFPEKRKWPLITYQRRVVEKKTDNTETKTFVEAAESVDDHKYSKEIKHENNQEESIIFKTDEEIIECTDELIIPDIKEEEDEENEVFTIKTEELDPKSLNDDGDERKIVIIHKLGENISFSQKKLEALLAAANADQVIICNTNDLENENGYVLIQNDENGEIGTESEFILSN